MSAKMSTVYKTHLNNMNRAADDVKLGTMIANMGTISTGSLSITEAQANASRVEVPTGLASVGGFLANIRRSGSPLMLKVTAGSVTGALLVENTTIVTTVTGGSKAAVDDVVHYLAFV